MTDSTNGAAEPKKPDVDRFVEDMMIHAQELHTILREEGGRNDIKDRITCLKYLEDVAKTYFVLKKATTHDPDAAGSTVRKYATAFATKNATGGRTARGRRTKSADALGAVDFEGDSESDDAA